HSADLILFHSSLCFFYSHKYNAVSAKYEKFFTIFFAFANPPIPFKAESLRLTTLSVALRY
ncbi:MAG: hypothetical protein LBC47_00685, partial [Tannerella sp.]|nr:hypothetical protein [Tannerella sp.]